MAVYIEINACQLYGEGWSWIKSYNSQKCGRKAAANLSDHYEVSGEVNNCAAWVTENIENAHFMSEHTQSFDKLY